jgi:hypothetical protein
LAQVPGAAAPEAEAKPAALLPEIAPLVAIRPNGNGNGTYAADRLS